MPQMPSRQSFVKHYGFFAFVDELLVEHVEHLKEAGAGRYVVKMVGYKRTLLFGAALTPYFQVYAY